MIRGDTQVLRPGHHVLEGIVQGVPKHSKRPVVDGILTGVPRVAHPSIKTPTTDVQAFATRTPSAAFGSGVFQHSAGPSAGVAEAKPKRGRKKSDS